ncbi:MAG: hypothetical protein CVV52_04005 [Spirochaetae bacterium HGW-Spirochaetae-8]|jgi:hypothetical protein|nr:MAG: hypothetical protein CVV52_04005 [Spirochaetae bacterium HGW-Spirochaetae-8]
MRNRKGQLLTLVLLLSLFSLHQIYSTNDLDVFLTKVDTVNSTYGNLVEEYQKIMQKNVTDVQSSEIGRVLEGFVGVKIDFNACITLAEPLRVAMTSNRSGVSDQLKPVTNVLLKDRLEAIIKSLDAQIVTLDNGMAIARSSLEEIPEYMNTLSVYRDALGYLVIPETNAGGTDYNMIQTNAGGTDYKMIQNDIAVKSGLGQVLAAATPEKVTKDYKVGDEGQAGGIVFYDKGGYSDGWRYLEATMSPIDYESIFWGRQGTAVGGTKKGIGSGKENTAKIVAKLGVSETYAASVCFELTTFKDGVKYDDWFLPSVDELDLMYRELSKKNIGGFSDAYYWSSSEYSSSFVWGQYFKGGGQYFSGDGQGISSRDSAGRVRPVRAF